MIRKNTTSLSLSPKNKFLLTESKSETLKWPSVDMFVHEARRNTFRESRNARMSAMEKSKSVGNALLNPPNLIQTAFGLANSE